MDIIRTIFTALQAGANSQFSGDAQEISEIHETIKTYILGDQSSLDIMPLDEGVLSDDQEMQLANQLYDTRADAEYANIRGVIVNVSKLDAPPAHGEPLYKGLIFFQIADAASHDLDLRPAILKNDRPSF